MFKKVFDDGKVKVWQFGFDVNPELISEFRKRLDPSDRARMTEYGRLDLQDRFVVRRNTLRQILAGELGVSEPKKLKKRLESEHLG